MQWPECNVSVECAWTTSAIVIAWAVTKIGLEEIWRRRASQQPSPSMPSSRIRFHTFTNAGPYILDHICSLPSIASCESRCVQAAGAENRKSYFGGRKHGKASCFMSQTNKPMENNNFLEELISIEITIWCTVQNCSRPKANQTPKGYQLS